MVPLLTFRVPGHVYSGIPRWRNLIRLHCHRFLGRYAKIQKMRVKITYDSLACFALGLTVGRIVLIPVNRKVKHDLRVPVGQVAHLCLQLGDALAIYV